MIYRGATRDHCWFCILFHMYPKLLGTPKYERVLGAHDRSSNVAGLMHRRNDWTRTFLRAEVIGDILRLRCDNMLSNPVVADCAYTLLSPKIPPLSTPLGGLHSEVFS